MSHSFYKEKKPLNNEWCSKQQKTKQLFYIYIIEPINKIDNSLWDYIKLTETLQIFL